ncbi:hypothetical protein G4177_22775 [Corallococcus sp. ZKHCc1 1396]|uniref:Uncharacterized protein n=1 Tax=Corallococcus soli TaxID=2710757 RepID=A0ABR9PSU2_9BACT|nr:MULTISPECIES: hypothetical protein [Corallococcus]MBE4751001.1 hypothetical protein [Corallococcus soli]MCY1034250.1 hypothetical protein [Corallococcus sp. BB11-1]
MNCARSSPAVIVYFPARPDAAPPKVQRRALRLACDGEGGIPFAATRQRGLWTFQTAAGPERWLPGRVRGQARMHAFLVEVLGFGGLIQGYDMAADTRSDSVPGHPDFAKNFDLFLHHYAGALLKQLAPESAFGRALGQVVMLNGQQWAGLGFTLTDAGQRLVDAWLAEQGVVLSPAA